MGMYNFDKVIDRRNSGSYKYEKLESLFGRKDLLPLWVADMDFETPDFIVDALKKRMEHPVFGYACAPEEWWGVVRKWLGEHHGWKVKEEWLTYIPGIVKGIGMAVNVFVGQGEKVIIQPPVYHPFRLTPEGNGREVVYNPLEEVNGRYMMDFDNLEEVCDEKCRMLILCNPHNPAGILWDKETLCRLAEFCYDHHLIVISDEIHCDIALWGKKHIPFASVSEKAAQCSVTFFAPSKTFNMAGLVCSYAVVPNATLRNAFYSWLSANELNEPDIFAPLAAVAAFKYGEEWRRQMISYLEGNIELVEDFCRERIPGIKPWRPDASFLVWLDCRSLRLPQEKLMDFFINHARLALNNGVMFGKEGEGFMRLNVGTPRAVLQKAMGQLEQAWKEFLAVL